MHALGQLTAAFLDQRSERGLRRQHGALELDQLALELIDLLHVRAAVAGEDALLEPFHVLLHVGGHLQIEIDHAVAYRVRHRPRPFGQYRRALLQIVAHRGERTGGAVPDGDDEPVAQQHHHVAGVDYLRGFGEFGVLDVLRGAQHQQGDVTLLLHHRSVTVGPRLLDGHLVQAEGASDRRHHCRVGVAQSQPDEGVASVAGGGVGVGLMRLARYAPPVDVQRAVDHRIRVRPVPLGPGRPVGPASAAQAAQQGRTVDRLLRNALPLTLH
jgi:hypothetical protein